MKDVEVNLVEAVEVYNVKRPNGVRSDGSSSGRHKTSKRNKTVASSSRPILPVPKPRKTTGITPMEVDGNISSAALMGDKPRKVRAPPRRLKVTAEIKDIWEKLGDSPAPLSLKDWVVLDKKVQKDLKDGLRFLGGRKPRAKTKGKEPAVPRAVPVQQEPISINLVQPGSEESESSASSDISSSEEEEDETTSGYETYAEVSTDEESDEDTVYDYPYERIRLESSTPLAVLGMVKDHPAKLILDSGSALSVMNRSFATQLGLLGSGDKFNIKTIETTKENRRRNQCEVTVAVPIRIGGRLRMEHMVIKEDNYSNAAGEPLVLLGMSFLRQYGITIHARDNLVEIPVRNGASSIMVQAYSTRRTEGQAKEIGAEVYSVSLLSDGSKPTGYDYVVEPFQLEEDVSEVYSNDVRYHGGITEVPGDVTYGEPEKMVTTVTEDNLKSYIDEALPEQAEFKYALDPETCVTTCGDLEDH